MNPSIEWQCVSLDWSRKLKALGVPQESAFYWCESEMGGMSVQIIGVNGFGKEHAHFSAFTVAELGEMLPDFTVCRKGVDAHAWQIECNGNDWSAMRKEPTEANARAAMLCHLIESKIINPSGG